VAGPLPLPAWESNTNLDRSIDQAYAQDSGTQPTGWMQKLEDVAI